MKSTPLAPAPALFAFAGCLLLLREAVFFVGFYILGSSINWPQSLGLPAAETFRLITAHPGAVFSGYYVYLLSSLLFVPIALVLRALLRGENAVTDVVLDVAAALAVLSVAFRALGILRWLFAMPTLAKTYLDPVSSPALREAAVLQFELLNAYAGKTGEHLGVGLLGAGFIAALAVALWRSAAVPRFYAAWAGVAAVLFVPFPDLLGFEGGPFLMVNGITFSLWLIALGVHLLRRARAAAPRPANA